MRSSPAALVAALALAGTASAQDFTFTIDQPASNWTWTGTTSIGPIQGNPSNAFQLAGTFGMDLAGNGNPVSTGQILGASAAVIPDLHGRVPNPIPGFPPLALIDVTNLVFSDTTPLFNVAGNGSFTTLWTVTIVQGTLTVTPLAGSVTTTNLAGSTGAPASNPGSITQSGTTLVLLSTQSATFTFTDPSSGISGTFTLTGTLRGTFGCPAPNTYCVTSPNSAGPGALISSSGSTSITANNLVLTATGAPHNQNGIFYFGPNQIMAPFGDGFRCVGGGVMRLGIVNAGPTGTFNKAIDYTNLPGNGHIESGDAWNFQCWYRDPAAGMSGYNFSNGLHVFFCP